MLLVFMSVEDVNYYSSLKYIERDVLKYTKIFKLTVRDENIVVSELSFMLF